MTNKRIVVLKNLIDYGFIQVNSKRSSCLNFPLLNREVVKSITYSDIHKSEVVFKTFIRILEKCITNRFLKIKLVVDTKTDIKLITHFIRRSKNLVSRISIHTNVIQYRNSIQENEDSLVINFNNFRFSSMLNDISSQEEASLFISLSNSTNFVYNEGYSFPNSSFSKDKRLLLFFLSLLIKFSKHA